MDTKSRQPLKYLRAFVEVENKENTLFPFSLDVAFLAVAAR